MKILIVNDHPEVRAKYIEALRVGGNSLQAAADAEEALQKLKADSFDVALIDLLLPGEMNGIDLIMRLRSWLPKILIVAIGQASGHAIERKALKAGANRFLSLSQVDQELASTIHSMLNGKPMSSESIVATVKTGIEPAPKLVRPRLLAGFSPVETADILNLAQTKTLTAGQTFFLDDSKEMIVLGEGEIEFYAQGKFIGCVGKDGCLGISSLWEKENRSNRFQLKAKVKSEIWLFDKSVLRAFFQAHTKSLLLRFVVNVAACLSEQVQQGIDRCLECQKGSDIMRAELDKRKQFQLEIQTN